MNKIITVYIGLTLIDIWALRLKELFFSLSKSHDIRVEGLDSRAIFKIIYRSYIEYLRIKLVAKLGFWEDGSIRAPK